MNELIEKERKKLEAQLTELLEMVKKAPLLHLIYAFRLETSAAIVRAKIRDKTPFKVIFDIMPAPIWLAITPGESQWLGQISYGCEIDHKNEELIKIFFNLHYDTRYEDHFSAYLVPVLARERNDNMSSGRLEILADDDSPCVINAFQV